MHAKLHWVEVFDTRFPVMAKTRQAALHSIIKKVRREAKVGVASAADVYRAGQEGIEILGIDDADQDGAEGEGGEAGEATTPARRKRSRKREAQ